ncbi:hypothetical protein [Candidatus Nitrosotenuis chungbukensis]|uniref:hypothetical protein n=2 Tax=Candidatus Nitrosotenuis chungbukensis TaxID=1353246 RepID=UPI0005B29B14|nr:hypothetical protein [Candidatus Nitrosotenuis chungbukensis]
MAAGKDFVDMCVICKQGVSREDMDYQKGKVFHAQCFTEHGNTVSMIDPELAHLSARTRIELVQLKNLKMKKDLEEPLPGTAKKSNPIKGKRNAAKKKGKVKKPTKKKVKKSRPKKAKKVKTKRRTVSKRR